MIEKYQFLQNNNDENYISIPLNLEYDFTRDADTIENFINNQVQNTLVNLIENEEITIYTPIINHDYTFYFSGSTTLNYNNLFNINGLFDPITSESFKNSLYIFEYYTSTNKDNQIRLYTNYYHLKQTDITSQHNNINNFLRLGIPKKYLPDIKEIYVKVKFFNGKDGKLVNFKNFNLYNTTSEDALYYKITLNHSDLTYSFEQKNLQFIQMVNNNFYNNKINNMYPSLSASTLSLPAGDFISGDGNYYDTTNPFDPKLINVDNGLNLNFKTNENVFLFKWSYSTYNPYKIDETFNGVKYQFHAGSEGDHYIIGIKVRIERVDVVTNDSNFYQNFLNKIDYLNPDGNPDIEFNFTDTFSHVKKPANTKVASYIQKLLLLPNRRADKSYTHSAIPSFDPDPNKGQFIFLDGPDDGYFSYIEQFALSPIASQDYYEFAYFLFDCPPNPDSTQNAHGIETFILSVETDNTGILDYVEPNGNDHTHIAYLIDKAYFQNYNKILYTDSSAFVYSPDFQNPVEGV